MRVQELTKQYDGKTVVDGVSFAIPKGKVISLIGPNGAGKSTVMGMISRLIAHDSGLVDFEGKDIGKWKSKELSKRLAILTQSNSIQMKLTVRELVTFGRFPYRHRDAHRRRVLRVFRRLKREIAAQPCKRRSGHRARSAFCMRERRKSEM